MYALAQGYSITNSTGPDFKTKKCSWAGHFQQLVQVITDFNPKQMNVMKSEICLFIVYLLNFVTSDTGTSQSA